MWDEDLNDLEEWIRRLRVEYEIFFNGHRRKPPEDLKTRVERQVKRLAEVNMNFSERFRYNTLVGRFYVYRDHWRRIMQEREQGAETRAGGPAPAGGLDSRPRKLPAGHSMQITITDPAAEEEKVRKLYEWLSSAQNRRDHTAPQVSYRQFVKYISAQTQGIKRRLGCASVVFRASLEDNAVKFTARGGEAESY